MFDDGRPIYLQIAEQISDSIVRGELAEESPVMSTNQYAAAYRINPATAAKAFTTLVEKGVLYKKRGIGMFVSAGAQEALRRKRRAEFFATRVAPLIEEARAIGIPLSDVIDHLNAEGVLR